MERYLWHILDAIDRATTYANKAVTFAAFEHDVLLQDGVIRNIGVIGEAAIEIGQVAPELVAAHFPDASHRRRHAAEASA